MMVRDAKESETDRLGELWHDAWQDSHAHLMPAELARHRTLERFRERVREALPSVRVGEISGEPAGICIVKGDELYQLFISAHARGSGVAAALIDDAEARLREAGVARAWLACAIGNDRAARFYEKRGWQRTGVAAYSVETPEGEVVFDVWRYEKDL